MITFNGKFQLDSDFCCSDKSLTHRALMLAAIADGTSTVRNVTLSRDVLATVNALRNIASVTFQTQNGRVAAIVTPLKKLPHAVTVDCEGSGTTARLLAGLFAGLGLTARFVGDASLMKRPMERVVSPLGKLGADIDYAPDSLFLLHGGKLHGTTLNAEVNSAQVKSAVVLAGLFADGETRYVEQLPTRNHTELMLEALGADVHSVENTVTVRKSRPHSFDLTLPNDPSAVAFGVALALLTRQKATFSNVLLNERRLGFYRVLRRAGAQLRFTDLHTVLGESVGNVEVLPSVLRSFDANNQDVVDGIDEIPLLVAVSLFVAGTHVFRGVKELAFKESNRLKAIEHIVTVCNQRYAVEKDILTVVSDGNVSGGNFFKSFGDHRIAMCETVVSFAAGSGSVDCAPYEISHPDFLKVLGVAPLKFGLVGSQVSNSVSPKLHAFLAMCAGVCCSYDAVVLPESASDAELTNTLRQFDGANVTMPFKTRAAALLGSDLPSVNTVIGGKCGTSTDGYGVTQSLKAHNIAFENQPLLIVGAGGAAEAAICELLKYGCRLFVVNRTEAHAEHLKGKYGLCESMSHPVGVLSFVPSCDFERNLSLPESCRFVLIADYKGQSGLREKALKRGIDVVNGLEMLFHQGAKSFSLWTGTAIQTDYYSFAKVKK